jgi:RNA polymerase primary sigma factor
VRRLETLAAESTTLQAYLQEIAKFPRLALEQEQELGRRIQNDRDRDALNALVEGNLRFVVSYARRYRRLGVPFLDLIHEGNIGLIEAARHFDPEGDRKFIAHGMWWVRQAIMHSLAEAQTSALRAQLEHHAATADAADDLETSSDDLLAMLAPGDEPLAIRPLGRQRDAHEAEYDDALFDQAIREIDDEPTREALVRQLEDAFDELEANERLVMRLRYGLQDDEPWTPQQIGDRMRVTGKRVKRIEARATQKLRRLQHVRGALN